MNRESLPGELKFKENSKKFSMECLLMYVQACPQIVQPGIGVETFVEELNNACRKFAEYFVKQD
jgi:hypothetical protein